MHKRVKMFDKKVIGDESFMIGFVLFYLNNES